MHPALTCDPLQRFYTRPHIGSALVSLIGEVGPDARILDLASGQGALAMAASRRWADASLVTVDLDPFAATNALGIDRHRHVTTDALDVALPDIVAEAAFDVTLCNPPYATVRWRADHEAILDQAGLAGAMTQASTSVDILFVAQNLRLAKSGGKIGLLVPDGLISGRRAMGFRAALLRDHGVETVVQLPPGAFVGTDARAFILVLAKDRAQEGEIALRRFDMDGGLSRAHFVPRAAAEERMDHDFHAVSGRGTGMTLADLGASVMRGSVDRSRNTPAQVLHTTEWPEGPSRREITLPEAGHSWPDTWVTAEPGDILVARVDRKLQKKVCGIAAGRAPISSSLFRIRVPAPHRAAVLDALLSTEGERRLLATSRGIGARMLGKDDLTRMCLPL